MTISNFNKIILFEKLHASINALYFFVKISIANEMLMDFELKNGFW